MQTTTGSLAHRSDPVLVVRRGAAPTPAAADPGPASRRALGNDYLARTADDWQEGPGGLLAGLGIGGPSDPAESQADLAAARAADVLHPRSRGSAPLVARRRYAGMAAAPSTAVPLSVAEVLATPGRPLDPGTQERMARTTGDDLSAVRIHDDTLAVRATADVQTAAWTVGHHIAFADGAFRPTTPAGDRLLAHELAHVAQQRRTGLPMLAGSVHDWMQSSPSLATMSYTDMVLEADDLQQWLDRQITSSPQTIRIEAALSEIRLEIALRDAQAVSAGRPPARRPRRGTAAAPAPLPARRPDVLTRMSSVSYTDPAEMRAQYDLIMQWLAVPQLAASERRILEVERANLAVLLQGERQRAAGERQATRLTLALTPAQADQGTQLGNLAAVIEGIVADPASPELFWIYDRGERIPISRAQRDSLRTTLHDQLAGAQRRLVGQVDYEWDRYRSQREVNAEFPVVSAISGWLGGVRDPGAESRATSPGGACPARHARPVCQGRTPARVRRDARRARARHEDYPRHRARLLRGLPRRCRDGGDRARDHPRRILRDGREHRCRGGRALRRRCRRGNRRDRNRRYGAHGRGHRDRRRHRDRAGARRVGGAWGRPRRRHDRRGAGRAPFRGYPRVRRRLRRWCGRICGSRARAGPRLPAR